MNPELEALRDRWAARWPEALGLWSRFTKLREPHWCFSEEDEKREELASSFAMIRLMDHAVVISLSQIAEHGLEDYPIEVMGHEIGHHVFCPGDLTDQARLIARIRRALPTKEMRSGFICNLYTDLLINDRLQRHRNLRMANIYKQLGSGSIDRMWTFYMRIYEILWNLPRHTLAAGETDKQLDFDAALGARLLRVYANDWLKGSGRFAALCFPYLQENDGAGVIKALRGWLDTPQTKGEGIPDGLTEMDEDEEEGSLHPANDPVVSGVDKEDEEDGEGKTNRGDTEPRKRYREPNDYRDIMRSVGVDVPDDELTIRYYRERAVPYLIRFPTREIPEATEPLPEGVEGWDFGESLDDLDLVESLLVSNRLIPGVTTVKRTYGTTTGSTPERQTVDLYIGVDCSGSMSNPSMQMSFPVLAGTIITLSALRAGARVMVTLSGEPGSFKSTAGFIRDEREILRVLTGYLGTGYAFGIHRLTPTFADRKETDRPVHVMIVTDHDIFTMLEEKSGGHDGWATARAAAEKARGGATYVLHMPLDYDSPKCDRMRKEGWDIAFMVSWEDILPFAREFSRKKYQEK